MNTKTLLLLFSSVQSRPTVCDPMNRSTPGLPVHHQLPEFTQTHVHRVRDAIQPSHPLWSPSPPAPNPSQHQSFPVSQLFAWGGHSTRVSALASFLPKKSQGWSPSEWTGWISLQSKGHCQRYTKSVCIISCNCIWIYNYFQKIFNLQKLFHILHGKETSGNAGDVRDVGLIPRSGRFPSCLENPMDRGAWWATVYRVTKNRTWLEWLSTHFICNKKNIEPQ